MKVKLSGKVFDIQEPCLKHLKIIMRVLKDKPTEEGIQEIIDCFTGGKVELKKIKEGELELFMNAVVKMAGLAQDENAPHKITHTKAAKPIDWGSVYAHLSACFGWTYDEIDNGMTLSKLQEYRPYMDKNPPVHQLVASYMGYEHKEAVSGADFLKRMAAQMKATH